MIRSMTAFASCETEVDGARLCWELRSVNHRYLDLNARLPESLRSIEPDLRSRISAHLKRGKLDCNLSLHKDPQAAAEILINTDRVDALFQASQVIARQVGDSKTLDPLDVLRWPGVQAEPEENTEALREAALSLLDQALLQLVETREREGEQIHALIEDRCQRIHVQVVLARNRLPMILQATRDKISKKIEDLVAEPDHDRLEQELVMLAQKIDVDEELDRLDGHIEEVRRVLNQAEPIGRRLDFLMQELTREANTLGSKSADMETTSIAIELKVLIEQMREQIQNIE